MISREHKFIFIHAPKTAGNSIQNILRNYSNDKIIRITQTGDVLERFGVENFAGPKHSTLNDYFRKTPNSNIPTLDGYFKFGCTRNPWDRAISAYFCEALKPLIPESVSLDRKMGKNKFDKEHFRRSLMFQPPLCAYYEVKNFGISKMDFFIRFENLQEDFNIACDKIGIPRQQLPHANKSKHKHYTEYYDDETRQIIAGKYAKDIEYFGYEFGRSAGR